MQEILRFVQMSMLDEDASIGKSYTYDEERVVKAILQSLTEELRYKKYRGRKDLGGYCYVASEALYHLLGREDQGYTSYQMTWEGESHWFLIGPGRRILDLTSNQYNEEPCYGSACHRSFMHPTPSKRASVVIERVKELLLKEDTAHATE